MKVSDILRVKGNTLYTASPDEPLAGAVSLMGERHIGSLGVVGDGGPGGVVSFRGGSQGSVKKRGAFPPPRALTRGRCRRARAPPPPLARAPRPST